MDYNYCLCEIEKNKITYVEPYIKLEIPNREYKSIIINKKYFRNKSIKTLKDKGYIKED